MEKLNTASQEKTQQAEVLKGAISNCHSLPPKYGIRKKKKALDISYEVVRLLACTTLAVVLVAGVTSIMIGTHWPITVIGGSLGLAISSALGFRPTILNVFRGE